MLIKVQDWPLDNVIPYIHNARSLPLKQIGQLKASIEANGFTNPILVDKAGVIIAGHGRLIAARELGLKTVPVIVLSDLSPVQAKALCLADNKIALNSGWDVDMLRLELGELTSADIEIDLQTIGFSRAEVDRPRCCPAKLRHSTTRRPHIRHQLHRALLRSHVTRVLR